MVDSYQCLPDVYSYIAHHIGLRGDTIDKFIEEMIKNKDRQDALKDYDRHKWWSTVFNQLGIPISENELIRLIRIYWKQRGNKSKILDEVEKT